MRGLLLRVFVTVGKSLPCFMRILTAGQLDGYQRRKDRTVTLRFVTQEKSSAEITEIDSMLDGYGMIYFRAIDQMNQDEVEELDGIELDIFDQPKKQSQRLRNVLWKVWEQEGKRGEFKTYYKQKTEEVIQHFKNKLDTDS